MGDVAVRLCAIRTLGHLESNAEGYASAVNDLLESEGAHPAVSMMAAWALPKMGNRGEQLMHQHKRRLEAEHIAAAEQNNIFGRCYRGVGEKLWSISQSLGQKVNDCL